MKTKIRAIAALLLLAGFTSVVIGKANTTVTITNNTSENLGIVAINFATGSPDYEAIPTTGVYPFTESSSSVSVTINHVTVNAGSVLNVTLPDQTIVKVDNTNGSPIVDINEQN